MSVARTRIPLLAETMKAAEAITGERFVNGTADAVTMAAAGEIAIGVADSDAATGDYFAVTTLGVVLVDSGAALSAGTLVQSDATGRAITLAAGKPLGRARTAATGADQKVSVFLLPGNNDA